MDKEAAGPNQQGITSGLLPEHSRFAMICHICIIQKLVCSSAPSIGPSNGFGKDLFAKACCDILLILF